MDAMISSLKHWTPPTTPLSRSNWQEQTAPGGRDSPVLERPPWMSHRDLHWSAQDRNTFRISSATVRFPPLSTVDHHLRIAKPKTPMSSHGVNWTWSKIADQTATKTIINHLCNLNLFHFPTYRQIPLWSSSGSSFGVNLLQLIHSWRSNKHDVWQKFLTVVQQLQWIRGTVQDAHPALVDHIPDRIQMRPVNVTIVLSVFQHVVTADLIVHCLTIHEPVRLSVLFEHSWRTSSI